MPTLGHGKICHLAIPAPEVEVSAAFYEHHFGFRVKRQPHVVTFDDGVDEVSGHFVPHATPMREAGILVYLMVDDLVSTVARLESAGVEIVAPPGVDPPLEPEGATTAPYTRVACTLRISRSPLACETIPWLGGFRSTAAHLRRARLCARPSQRPSRSLARQAATPGLTAAESRSAW